MCENCNIDQSNTFGTGEVRHLHDPTMVYGISFDAGVETNVGIQGLPRASRVTWSIEDPTIAELTQLDDGGPIASIRPLKDGTTKISASADFVVSNDGVTANTIKVEGWFEVNVSIKSAEASSVPGESVVVTFTYLGSLPYAQHKMMMPAVTAAPTDPEPTPAAPTEPPTSA